MRKRIAIFLEILLCFILQTTVFRHFAMGGIVPNLLIILTVSTGMMMGEQDGCVTGLACGLLVDIFFGFCIGFYGLLFLYVGFLAGLFHRVFYPENVLMPFVIILSFDFLYGFLCYVLLFLMRTRFDIGAYLQFVILPEMIYTAVCSLALYPLLLRIFTRADERDMRGAKKFV